MSLTRPSFKMPHLPGRRTVPMPGPDEAAPSAVIGVVPTLAPGVVDPIAGGRRRTRRSAEAEGSAGAAAATSSRGTAGRAATSTDLTSRAPAPATATAATHKAPSRPPKRRIRAPEATDLEAVSPPTTPDHGVRVMLVEDVADVTSHIRDLLTAQSSIRILQVVKDGRAVANEVRDLRPDVVVVDSLLQGRVSGATVVERLRRAKADAAIVLIEVPTHPISDKTRGLVDVVLTMPFNAFGLVGAIRDASTIAAARNPALSSRIVAVYAAKGGVGKTTISYNLAVALAGSGLRTALIDGSLQYGDIRRQRRIGPDVPSICDLPIESRRQSDLAATMYRDTSGVDILLAPPRLEMADLITVRDLEEILDIARRTYQAIVIDTTSALNETTLAMLDLADVILQVLTPEPAALDSTRAAADAFAAIGYPASKVRLVVNRADAAGGLTEAQLRRAFGREPDHRIASDWARVSSSNSEGVPFVTAHPDAPVSRDVRALATQVASVMVSARPARRTIRTRR